MDTQQKERRRPIDTTEEYLKQFHRYEVARREQGVIKQINQFQRQWDAQKQQREQLAAHGQAQREAEQAQASARLQAQQQVEAQRKLAQEAQMLLLKQQAEAQRLADQQRRKALVEAEKEVKARQRWATKGESPIEISFRQTWVQLCPSIKLVCQYRIGSYRVDFCHMETRLVIELDGHGTHSSRRDRTKDAQRERWIQSQGWHVVRFTGTEIHADVVSCVQQVQAIILQRSQEKAR